MNDFRCGFPDWILRALVSGGPPEHSAVLLEWPDFDHLATLHDSCWYGLVPNVSSADDVMIGIHWDHVWQAEPIKSHFSNSPHAAVLFLKFCGVQELRFRNYGSRELKWSPIGDAEYHPGTARLVIQNIYGGEMELSPVREVGVWLYDTAGDDHTALLRAAYSIPTE